MLQFILQNYMKALDPLIVHNDGETIPRSVVYKSIDDHEQVCKIHVDNSYVFLCLPVPVTVLLTSG